MDENQRQDAIRQHIDWCKDQKTKAQEVLDFVGKGWTFHESAGNEPMRDVTVQRVAEKRGIIEQMDRIIAAYGRANA